MPTVSPTPAPLPPAYGFSATFFKPYVAPPPYRVAAETSGAGPGTRYCEATHGSHADFCRGPDFSRYRDEVRQDLDFLGDFCVQHRMPDATRIVRRFDQFFTRRFHLAHFDTHAHLVDSAGKRALDNICDMVRDERISLDTRCSVIRDLSRGLDVCASGTTANLIAADRDLALSSEGIRPALWKVKQDITHDILLRAVSAEYAKVPRYAGNEIHYFNAAWNHVAESVGLTKIPDLMARILPRAFLERCRNEVHAALTPVALARVMAKQCLDIFASGLAARKIAPSGNYTARTHEVFAALLLEARQQYQLGPDTLRLHTFAQLDDDGTHYDLRRDSSLIARDLLIAMHSEHLLNEAPFDWGGWHDADGDHYTLYTFGTDLAWRLRRYGAHAAASEWDSNADVEPTTIADLHAWCAWRQLPSPPPNAVRQAMLIAGPEALADIPPDWLRDPDTMRAVVAMSNRELLLRCLQADLSCFVKGMAAVERAALIDNHIDAGEAMLRVACGWYANPWMLMGEPCDNKGRSRLQRWMASENVQALDAMLGTVDGKPYLETGTGVTDLAVYLALRGQASRPVLAEAMSAGNAGAIDAWRRLVSHPAVIPRVKDRLRELLLGAIRGCPMYFRKDPRVIQAFHRILTHPVILPYIVRDLPILLAAESTAGVPVLSDAMREGCALYIYAFHGLLVHPAILPHIKHKLPELLAARSPAGCTALDWGLAHGNWQSMRAFNAMLTDPLIFPHIVHRLPALFVTKVRDGKVGLAAALGWNRHMVIRAYGALLSDPAIVPHIKHLLPKLLAAKTYAGDPGLAIALERGHALAINAFQDVVADPDILPHIARALPKLLAARRRNGMPGLALALLNNRDGATASFGEVLADPRILPYIRHVLVDLLAARDASGTTGVELAARQERFHAMANFFAILEKPAIARHIESRLTEILPLLQKGMPASTSRVEQSVPGRRPWPGVSVRDLLRRLASRLAG